MENNRKEKLFTAVVCSGGLQLQLHLYYNYYSMERGTCQLGGHGGELSSYRDLGRNRFVRTGFRFYP